MRVQLEKRGVLGAGQVKKGGSLPRHIPILNIYVSTPPGLGANIICMLCICICYVCICIGRTL